MADFGQYLRSHREAAGVDLEQMAAQTRISVRLLDSLETERFERLPGGVFNFSFVRQYARCVGLDEDDAVERFRAVAPSSVSVPFESASEEHKDPFLARTAAARVFEAGSGFLYTHFGTIASLAIGTLLVFGGLYSYETWEPASAPQLASVDPTPQPSAKTDAVVRNAATTRRPAPARASLPIELRVEITDTVWIRALADGARVFEGTYRAGQSKPISARENVTLNVGNAGGVRLALNGNALPALGPRGHVRRVKVTTEGMEVLYASPKPTPPSDGSDEESTRAASDAGAVAWSGR